MTQTQYILSSALPFDLDAASPEADRLFAAVPESLRTAWSGAEQHEDELLAGDGVEDWITANWRVVLPEVSARF